MPSPQAEQLIIKLAEDARRKLLASVGRGVQAKTFSDIQDRMNAYRVAITTGVMSVNEVREMEGLPTGPIVGDVKYVPAIGVTPHSIIEAAKATIGFVVDHESGTVRVGPRDAMLDADVPVILARAGS